VLLQLEELREVGRSFELALALPELVDEQGAALLAGPARVRGSAGPGARGVELEARIDAGLRLACSRCLEPFVHPVGIEVRLRLTADAEQFAREADDVELFHAVGGVVDLAAVALEQLVLSLPLKPICLPACRGLCPSCGVNRNAIECGCSRAEGDPRLAPLRALRARLGRDERD